MQENIPLIEVTKDEIKRIAWYRQEKPDNEVMSRMILWEDDTSEGCIEYNCCEKRLYDRIIDYFKIKKRRILMCRQNLIYLQNLNFQPKYIRLNGIH